MTSHFWGQITDYQATRFALPIYLFGIPGCVLFLSEMKLRRSVQYAVAYSLAAYGLLFTISSASRSYVTHSMVPSLHANYFLDFANNHTSSGNLFLSDGVIGLIAYGHAAYPVQDINRAPEAILRMAGYKLYQNFYALEMYELDPVQSKYVPQAGGRSLNPKLVTKVLEEKIFMPSYMSRIVKIVGVRTPEGVVSLDQVGVRYPADVDGDELLQQIFSNFPTAAEYSSSTDTLYDISKPSL
jgi:hypothetical protein